MNKQVSGFRTERNARKVNEMTTWLQQRTDSVYLRLSHLINNKQCVLKENSSQSRQTISGVYFPKEAQMLSNLAACGKNTGDT
jgi:hypothetical protein